MKNKFAGPAIMGVILLLGIALIGGAQVQQSGGPGSTVTVGAALPAGTNVIGHVIADTGSTTAVTGNVAVTGTFWQATQPVSGTVTVNALPTGSNVIGHVINDSGSTTAVTALPATPTGTNNIGIVRTAPSSCTQSTNFTSSTVGVATSTGTSVSSTTTCVTLVYVNNITNSPVTFQLQDKTGTPIVWVGGNANFSIPANSNASFPLGGVVFTSGITAIAGTGSALNLQVSGLQ